MRIPLDYYKILGVPMSATEGQISQAYHDRALQLPRREYSDAAINARKQLLDQAYEVLSDQQRRSEYEATIKKEITVATQSVELPLSGGESSQTGIEENNPEIDIPKPLFVGALLLLQELGEYDYVLQLGEPYLDSRHSISLDKGIFGDPQLIRADIVLTLALACLELGRDQWQQGQYENAATSGQVGQKLLLKENLFPGVRGEIQTDLYKLRPYQILELLALPENQVKDREKGLYLLQEMLTERGGIDGTGNDQSGLSVDDFLRFIQQLRTYLTATEQQEFFEAESRRPSAVATYLAIYALLGRGFTERQPQYIYRAKELLVRLAKRQDVCLEQAVCCLLLGETEQASQALEHSKEKETLDFIREHSRNSPDLLPGLCLYAEQWLQKEVFPHFRDLASQTASLKVYFADEDVQTYLEQLTVEDTPAPTSDQWAVVEAPQTQETGKLRPQAQQYAINRSQGENAKGAISSGKGSFTPMGSGLNSEKQASLPNTDLTNNQASRRQQKLKEQLQTSPLGVPISGNVPPGKFKRKKTAQGKGLNLLLLSLAGLLGLGLLAWLVYGVVRAFSAPSLDGTQPLVQLDEPPVPIPPIDAVQEGSEGEIDSATAEETIRTWLNVKGAALGANYEIEQLETILVEPELSRWRESAIATQRNNAHWQYNHELSVESVQTSETEPDQASVEANIDETAQFYQGGELRDSASYRDNLRVRYDLIRQESRWKIRGWEVLS